MNVRVQLHGVIGRGAPAQDSRFDLSVPDGATAGDLVGLLAGRYGAPLRIDSEDPRIPRHIRMFADGELLSTLEQRLARGSRDASVNVVVLSPMMGG